MTDYLPQVEITDLPQFTRELISYVEINQQLFNLVNPNFSKIELIVKLYDMALKLLVDQTNNL